MSDMSVAPLGRVTHERASCPAASQSWDIRRGMIGVVLDGLHVMGPPRWIPSLGGGSASLTSLRGPSALRILDPPMLSTRGLTLCAHRLDFRFIFVVPSAVETRDGPMLAFFVLSPPRLLMYQR
jgi:hypothetical protein